MKKKVLGRRKREFLLFMERILVVLFAVSAAMVFTNSFRTVDTSYGVSYRFTLSPLETKNNFEDHEIFRTLVQGNMEKITRYVAIRSELETGGKYDPQKKIEISDYVNRSLTIVEEQPTAQFYLDDLIKWGNYGFTYRTVIGTWEELNRLFSRNKAVYTKETIPGIQEYGSREPADPLALGLRPAEDGQYAMELLVSRYKTTDGKELMECAANVEEYEQLKKNLVSAASSLFTDYTDYVKLQEMYGADRSNIGYCFQVQIGKKLTYYSNDRNLYGGNIDEITAAVKGKEGRFLYFNPDKMQINTNMGTSAVTMRTILKPYEHIFGDNTRVWFWVNTDYPVQDDFYTLRESLQESRPITERMLVGSVAALLGIFSILIYLTKKEGRILTEEDGLQWKLEKQDSFPIEVWFILVVLIFYFFLCVGWQLFVGYKAQTLHYSWLPLAAGLTAFINNELILRFYFSLIRRIKAKAVWETTLIRRMGIESRNALIKTYENGNLIFRTWIPYLIFLMLNLILVLLGMGGVVGAFLLDMLIGIYLYRETKAREGIIEGIEKIKNGQVKHRIDTTYLHGGNLKLANSVNTIGNGLHKAVETSMKDEKLKTDLITNVSHDIKTPLTSIITYVDLMKREEIDNEKIRSYLAILDNKSQRLKQLIDDLVEASKISSGNISIHLEKIDFVEMLHQALGEFGEKFEDKQLQIVSKLPDRAICIKADSSQLWRVLENLFQNISKYALPGTRVYIELEVEQKKGEETAVFSAKNISAGLLEMKAEELTERFMRGDRSRRTEGSGLGLSIAKNLIEAQSGSFEIQVDGDLFKAMITFPVLEERG